MSLRRVGWLAAAGLAVLICTSCGQVYRPVVLPVNTIPPNPAGFHEVFAISTNIPANQGAAMQIDVAGDSNIGEANMGVNPTHAVMLPNNSRLFVASAGSLYPGFTDSVTAVSPAVDAPIATGLGNPTVISFPNTQPNLSTCSYLPDFVTAAQTTAVYVANYGTENNVNCNVTTTDSVAIVSPALNSISLVQYLPPASHPVAMVETPDSFNLYVLNQNNTVVNLSPTDLTTQANVPLGSSTVPVWAVARPDAQKVYLVTQGDGALQTITTSSNTITATQSVGGPGANFVLYDNSRNRLYVTNPGNGSAAGAVYVFDATTDPPTPLGSATGVVSIPAPSPCSVMGVTCSPVAPVSVTALSDGSRFYVASYVTATIAGGGCPDSNVTTTNGCVIPQVTIFDAASLTLKPVSSTFSMLFPSLSLLGAPLFGATQYAIALPSTGSPCAPAATFTPASTRFRLFTTASTDASHVFVSMCDAGAIADIATTTTTLPTGGTNTPDVLVTDLSAPVGAVTTLSGGTPPPQNPVFLLTGQ